MMITLIFVLMEQRSTIFFKNVKDEKNNSLHEYTNHMNNKLFLINL